MVRFNDFRFLMVVLGVLTLAASACSWQKLKEGGSRGSELKISKDTPPWWELIEREVMDFSAERNETCNDCHSLETGYADPITSDYSELMASGSIVAGNPEASRFYQVLVAGGVRERMPKNGPPLPQDRIDLVYRWIKAGAPLEKPEGASEEEISLSPPAGEPDLEVGTNREPDESGPPNREDHRESNSEADQPGPSSDEPLLVEPPIEPSVEPPEEELPETEESGPIPAMGLPPNILLSKVVSPSYAEISEAFLDERCFDCHNARVSEADLNVMDFNALMSSPGVVVPGKPEESLLYTLTDPSLGPRERMPPGRAPALTTEQRQLLFDWIEAGAPFEVE